MTITYRVDPEAGLILTTGRGVLTDSELEDYTREVLADPETRPGFNELHDLRKVTSVQVSDRGMGVTVRAILEFQQQVKETKTALVASDRNAKEINRIYELLRTSVPATVQLFRDMPAARAWLGLPEERERRRCPRKTVRLNVQIRKGIQEFSGRLIDISLSGALLQCASFQLLKGNFVKIHFQPDWSSPVELTGTVVRHADSTFAIQFLSVTDELVDLLARLP